MRKHFVGLAIAVSAVLAGGCVVEDEAESEILDEGQLEDGEQIQYAAGTCGVVWYDLGWGEWYRIVSADSFGACDHEAGTIGNQHCNELRAGAPGPNPLYLEFQYTNSYGQYQYGAKTYYCQGVPLRDYD